MSYARFGPHSDVYVFLHVNDSLTCCGCSAAEGGHFWCDTADQMIEHLRLHEAAGHKVPAYTIEALEEERDAGELP